MIYYKHPIQLSKLFLLQAVSKGKKEQERYTALAEKLHEEKKKQQEHVEKVLARLRQVKNVIPLCETYSE